MWLYSVDKYSPIYIQAFLRRASLVAQTVKICLSTQETHVQSLGWEDPLEEEIAIPSSILLFFLLKNNCFTEFCCFLSNLNMNQP